MSGDIGVHHEPVIFYSKEMTQAKEIFLKLKGINVKLYKQTISRLKSYE